MTNAPLSAIIKSNRTCPRCAAPQFKVAHSKSLPDGSVHRERICEACGHVEERIAPAEKPLANT